MSVSSPVPVMSPSLPVGSTAVIYCEGQFGEQDGKTANGLVRHSEKYDVLSVVDSRRAGQDAGQLLDGKANGIPVLASLAEALAHAGRVPDYLICGLAPADGLLSPAQRVVLLDGIARGMHVINGLHDFLNDDAEFVAAALLADVTITDVRRPKDKKDLKLFSGPHLRRHLPADRRARHRRCGRQAHHRDPPREGPERPRHQGRPGRHRPDHDHAGRQVRRRPGRARPAVLLGRGREPGRRRVRGRGPRRDRRRGPGRPQPPGVPDLGPHPARQPAGRRHRPARPRAPGPRRLPDDRDAHASPARSRSSRASPTPGSSASRSTTRAWPTTPRSGRPSTRSSSTSGCPRPTR